MTARERLERVDGLYRLLTRLPGWDFGVAPECAETDPEVFFPEPGESCKAAQAKAICVRCPIRLECLEFALREGWTHGIWGGTSEVERRELRRDRRLAAAGGEVTGGMAA